MLEEKNDNLSQADGNLNPDFQNENQITNQDEQLETTSEPTNIVSLTEDEMNNDAMIVAPATDAMLEIATLNAEENEEESFASEQEIEILDYETLTMEQLTSELEKLVVVEKVMSVKNHIEDIKKAFSSKYNHFIEEKKEEFLASNPDPLESFEYHFPLKSKFDQLYYQYKDKKTTHFKKLQNDLKGNLEVRLQIVEELKSIIDPQNNMKDSVRQFNDLKERWKNAGPIPKDKYNHVWNNYHFHLENFYDYLHLDREARDQEFKHNLELKLKIIDRVSDLAQSTDVNKAFKELQGLHKIWKEDIGPVSKEHRDAIWNKFSEATKLILDKRENILESQREREAKNLELKSEIINQIKEINTIKVSTHDEWQKLVAKVESLRDLFFNTGKVPQEENENVWQAFKVVTREFNTVKNTFYKDIKKDQLDNLLKKNALLEKARSLQESDDFSATTPIIKQIQEEFKNIGHVPRKDSDRLWKEFKETCNAYFDRLKKHKNEASSEELEAYENKKEYLEKVRTFELIGEHRTDLDAIKAHIETWKSFGKVPQNKRAIEGKFNKILDVLFEKLSLSKRDSELLRFNNRVEQLAGADDTRKLENEKIFISRKIDEIQNEIFQLENNIQFFTNTKNAKKENPIVLEVRKNIEKHKESLQLWKEKLKQLREIKG